MSTTSITPQAPTSTALSAAAVSLATLILDTTTGTDTPRFERARIVRAMSAASAPQITKVVIEAAGDSLTSAPRSLADVGGAERTLRSVYAAWKRHDQVSREAMTRLADTSVDRDGQPRERHMAIVLEAAGLLSYDLDTELGRFVTHLVENTVPMMRDHHVAYRFALEAMENITAETVETPETINAAVWAAVVADEDVAMLCPLEDFTAEEINDDDTWAFTVGSVIAQALGYGDAASITDLDRGNEWLGFLVEHDALTPAPDERATAATRVPASVLRSVANGTGEDAARRVVIYLAQRMQAMHRLALNLTA